MKIRIGQGFDIHRIEADETSEGLWISGVLVPCPKRVVAHSDGDVVFHAVIDALLGALSLGDIGQWFPDNDPKYKGVSSSLLIKQVVEHVNSLGFYVSNVDVTVIAERPKLKNYMPSMCKSLALALGIPVTDVSIKAKTHERVDAVGQELAYSAQAVVLLNSGF